MLQQLRIVVTEHSLALRVGEREGGTTHTEVVKREKERERDQINHEQRIRNYRPSD